jgi:uncharacterized membrane protein YhfC
MDFKAFFHLLNGLWMVLLPAGLGFYLARKFRTDADDMVPRRLLLIGAATFVLSQVFHIPFNQFILAPGLNALGLAARSDALRPLANALAAGLSAGLFESGARYLAYRWWAKDARSWGRGLLLGVGHGGIEAIILGVLVIWGFIQMSALRNANLAQFYSADQLTLAQQQVSAYWSLNWYDSLLGAFERTFTLPIHLAASLLVLQVFTRKRLYWLGLAIGWHALADAGLVYLLTITRNIYLTEGWGALVGVASLVIIWRLRQPEPLVQEKRADTPTPAPLILSHLPRPEETTEQLDQTRFGN